MADNRCRAQWDGPTPYAVLCELPAGHAENHRGRGPHMIAQWPQASPPEPVLTRAEAEQRLTDDVMERIYREAHNGYTGAYPVLRGVIIAAMFPDGGQG